MQRFLFLSCIAAVSFILSGCSLIRTQFYKEPDGGETRDMVAWQFGTFRQNTFRSEQEDGRDLVEWTDEVEGRDTLLRLIDAAVILGKLATLRSPNPSGGSNDVPPPIHEQRFDTPATFDDPGASINTSPHSFKGGAN